MAVFLEGVQLSRHWRSKDILCVGGNFFVSIAIICSQQVHHDASPQALQASECVLT